MSLKPKVALSQDFLATMSKLPSSVQGKVLKWALKFQSDPTSPGINYETIQNARDPNIKSVRIDQDWRGIVFKPTQGDVYVLLHVGHHDEAYRWAEQRRMTVNHITGAMQIVVTQEVLEAAVAQAPATPAKAPALYAKLTDTVLVSLGVPSDHLPLVRTIKTEDELDQLLPLLPIEAYEALFLIAAGDTAGQILSARETREDRKIDTADFAKAIEAPESQARFVVVDNDEELAAILNAPLEQWRVFLHPTQRKLATADMSGPARVLGGPGTGKTVLAMHRAKWLAEHVSDGKNKILFTTFTKNLALDVEQNLRALCNSELLKRIEVRNLDAWVHAFLRGNRYEHKIVYGRSGDAELAWQRALTVKEPSLGLQDDFYAAELEQVVLAQGVTTLDEYRKARRAGRGVILTRSKRDAIWPVFEEYRAQLSLRKLKEVDDAFRDAATLLEQRQNEAGYCSIVVDETQDFGPQALRLLRSMVAKGRNDLFLVGDGHQRIYNRHRAALTRCGIDIRGRGRKLYLNYRTTDEIRRTALALLEGCEIDDLDDGADENKRYKSLTRGPLPEQHHVATAEAAIEFILMTVNRWHSEQDKGFAATTAIVAPSKHLCAALKESLAKANVPASLIDGQHLDSNDPKKISIATMHRAKGLEFDEVIVLAEPLAPLDGNWIAQTQRRLLYVAVTRAKRRTSIVWLP